MSKRGQVFILAAMLMAVILFSLSAIRNKSEQRQIKGDFEALSENYKIEASKLINSAIKQTGINPHEAFKSFSTMFTSYAKGKNPEYGLIYILSFEDKIQVTNFLDRDITIKGCGELGNEYSIIIPGGFNRINAALKFEEFDIKVDRVPTDLEFDCENITISMLSTEPHKVSDNIPCAFLYPEGGVIETELAVVIDGAPYKSCIKKGVPEIMQVGIMKQGEQAKVSATGSCISEDFCEGLGTDQCGTCGRDVCFWWQTTCPPPYDGLCLNKYAYPSRDPTSGTCPATTCVKACLGDRIFYNDDCGNPIGASIDNCEEEDQKVCRNAKCCTKQDSKKCCGDDLCWISSCDTQEGIAEDCAKRCKNDVCCIEKASQECVGKDVYYFDSCGTKEEIAEDCGTGSSCKDPGTGPQCCNLEQELRCDGDAVYYYSSCGTIEKLVLECNKKEGWVCRDKYYLGGGTLPATARCCVQNFGTKCDGSKVYYYSSCGTKEGLKEDCGSVGCANGACSTNKQFQCECSKYSGDGWDYAELTPQCINLCGEGATCKAETVGGDSGDWYCTCINTYWTGCSASPSCNSGDTKLAEQSCCLDGTQSGQCSTTKPKYCDNQGSLVDNCGTCGCPSSYTCQPDGSCKQSKKLKCVKDTDYRKSYWCTSKNCKKDYSRAYCDNACAPDVCSGVREESGCGSDNQCELWCYEVKDSDCAETPVCPSGYSPSGNPINC